MSDKGCLLNKSLQSANTSIHQGRSNVKGLVIALHDSLQILKKNVELYRLYIMLYVFMIAFTKPKVYDRKPE